MAGWRNRIGGALLGLLAIAVVGLVWLDTPSGHRFVAARIAKLAPASGLRIQVGHIEGSIYRRMVLRDVTLSDPQGRFLSIPGAELDWWPVGWLRNRLDIDALIAPTARLHRLPKLRATGAEGPKLPDFDIRIMKLSVGRLDIDQPVLGRPERVTLEGDADIRSGEAVVDLRVRALRGGDTLLLALDARPDANRFDVDLTVNAPRGGVLAAVAGLKSATNVRVQGDGDWTKWDGTLVATLDGRPAGGLALKARAGRYGMTGRVEGGVFGEKGLLARLTKPSVRIDVQGSFANRLASGTLTMQSDAVDLKARGGIDLRAGAWDALSLDALLRRPGAIAADMGGRDVRARMRIDGPFATSRLEYLLTATELRFGRTVLHQVRASGTGQKGGVGKPMLIPVDLSAASVDGQGAVVGSILRNFKLNGVLQKNGGVLTSNPMTVRSDKLNAKLVALFDLGKGRYDLALTGDLRGLLIPGLGVVDLRSAIKAVPDRAGAFSLSGKAEATMRRLDNAFLRGLAGGLPRLRSDLTLDSRGTLRLSGLDLRAPQLALTGQGERLASGAVHIIASGAHRRYGPVKLDLSGDIARPKADVRLASPMPAAGLADVHLVLDPSAQGYAFRATGQSTLGPLDANGQILLPRGEAAVIAVSRLEAGDAVASGQLRLANGGFDGRLDLVGALQGSLTFTPEPQGQRITVALNARDARFAGARALSIRFGRVDGTALLTGGSSAIEGTAQLRGVQWGQIRLNQLRAQARLVDGAGTVQANLSGQRGRSFRLQLSATVQPGEWVIDASGTLDRQPLRLSRPARLTRMADGGWQLDPVALIYRGGTARVTGMIGGQAVRLDATLGRMPLSLLDLSNSSLGLGGTASGTLRYEAARGAAPTGTVDLRASGLTRSGITRTSLPLDLGVVGRLDANRLALRLVAAQNGKTVGRGQALIQPLGQGSIADRIQYGQLQAQLRWSGPAEALWRLGGVEIIDLGGPLAIGANVRGTLASPVIAGALATRAGTLTSPTTGMQLTGMVANGRFDGSRLVLSTIFGKTPNNGQVSGHGTVDFSSVQGIGLDMAFQATYAQLLDRDDLGATVTGPITIKSDGNGGVIAGDFLVPRSRFTLGRAAAVASIPQLQLIERNGRGDDFEPTRAAAPWRLAIRARAPNRLMVDGLGLNSEWSMNLGIGGTVTAPQMDGVAEMVRGTYDFAGRRFDITEGTIYFEGGTTDPRLDITAQADVNGLSATIRISGNASKPIIGFTSVPALPEDEVLSRILFGSSITALSAPEAVQLAGAVASLQGKGGMLDPINAVRKLTGLDRLRIVPADSTTGQRTSVAVGKYVTRRTYVELISDGQGYSATRVEYQVTRWLSLLASISTIGRQSAAVRVSKDY